MKKYIPLDDLVAEIERRINEINLDSIEDWRYRLQREHDIEVMKNILSLINTIEVKEVDLELTWEDVACIHNILNKCRNEKLYDTKKEFYQDILKRFKEQKEEV